MIGFRSNNFWKKSIAVIVYLFAISMIAVSFEGVTLGDKIINVIFPLSIMVPVYLSIPIYEKLKKKEEVFCNPNLLVRFGATLIYGCIYGMITFLFMGILNLEILDKYYSPEQKNLNSIRSEESNQEKLHTQALDEYKILAKKYEQEAIELEEKLKEKEAEKQKLAEIEKQQREKLAEAAEEIDRLQKELQSKEDSERLAQIEAQKKAEESKRVEEESKKQELATANNKPSSNDQTTSNSSEGSSTASNVGSYYVVPGNRYYHKTSTCKFLEGASANKTSSISNKFPCNCVKYN